MKKYFFLVVFILICGINSYAQDVDASATGISRSFNPAISVNSLFHALQSNKDTPIWGKEGLDPGLHFQEVSVDITSNVDIYLQSKVVFAFEEHQGVGLEEAYLSTLRMPIPVILKFGKMFNTFGRHNLYHSHHMAFAERPLILEQVFGHDLNEVSIEGSYLAPVYWYMDATIGLLNGDNERLFNSDSQRDFAYLFHLDNLCDLSDEVTLRFGGSYLLGKRGLYYNRPIVTDINKIFSQTFGVDFYLKWKPLQYDRYHSFILQGEYVNTLLEIDEHNTKPLHGFFLQALYQFDLRWWIQARYGLFEKPEELFAFYPNPESINIDNDINSSRISCAVAYVPTEFSAYRLQYNYIKLCDKSEHQLVAQVNVTIGSHPAHKY